MGTVPDDRTGEADLSGFLRGGKLYGFPTADPAEDGNRGENTENGGPGGRRAPRAAAHG